MANFAIIGDLLSSKVMPVDKISIFLNWYNGMADKAIHLQ